MSVLGRSLLSQLLHTPKRSDQINLLFDQLEDSQIYRIGLPYLKMIQQFPKMIYQQDRALLTASPPSLVWQDDSRIQHQYKDKGREEEEKKDEEEGAVSGSNGGDFVRIPSCEPTIAGDVFNQTMGDLTGAQGMYTAILNEKPLCFPIWGERRLKYLEETHAICLNGQQKKGIAASLVKDRGLFYRPQVLQNCTLCEELTIWRTLNLWYQTCFLAQKKTSSVMLADGSLQPMRARNKGLIILGQRGTGKTKFFQSFCTSKLTGRSRIVHVKNTFNAEQWRNLNEAWLILIDDFKYSEQKHLEIFKALLAGEETIIEGKWLAKPYPGGIPCVLLCNDVKQFRYFKTNPYFSSDQCHFINLNDYFIGPPEFNKHSDGVGSGGSGGDGGLAATGSDLTKSDESIMSARTFRRINDTRFDQESSMGFNDAEVGGKDGEEEEEEEDEEHSLLKKRRRRQQQQHRRRRSTRVQLAVAMSPTMRNEDEENIS